MWLFLFNTHGNVTEEREPEDHALASASVEYKQIFACRRSLSASKVMEISKVLSQA
ncbi:hypothetical protein MPTK1_2g24830 [Marchantia polymorpha subsp. ruderalis]|uniref:Uncharacterized protein n=1 Tax=Marchantia polymorpha TaxID=3197 RepID=A0A2R6W200_MARPO|nr:hypothetical protein MARPO_0181s0014 [Marchantia polymorpha]BBN03603.1 hypothetical protein Mp_2g24830 [Marchantia polymorpha subsp. ruderalis]|eukprot:PTQ27872.1 hypothetical protein MARPO_0181s0014 [Marchantia polymorpha]